MMNHPDTDARITQIWDEIPKVSGTARADLLMELGDHLMDAERHSEAVPVLQTSHDLYVEAGVDWMAGRVAHDLGVALGHLGRADEQLAAEHDSIDRFERAQRRDLAGCSRMSLGLHLRGAGRLKEALAVFKAAADDFAATNEPLHRGNALSAMLEAEVDLGRFPAAARLLGPTLHVFQACGLFGQAAESEALAATAMVDLARSSDALNQLRRVAPVLAACHRPRAEVDARLALARLLLATGDAKGAVREAKRAESIARRGLLEPQLEQAHVLRNKAEQPK